MDDYAADGNMVELYLHVVNSIGCSRESDIPPSLWNALAQVRSPANGPHLFFVCFAAKKVDAGASAPRNDGSGT